MSYHRSFKALQTAAQLLLVTVMGLAGCTSTSGPLSTSEEAELSKPEITAQVRSLLDEARQSDSPERDRLYLQAAQHLVTIEEDDWARNLLSNVDSDLLFAEDFVNYTMVYSQIAIDDDAYFLAQRILTNPRIEQQWEALDPDALQILRQRRAEIFSLLGESTSSVLERIRLGELGLSDEFSRANQDAIWSSLMTLPAVELQRLADTVEDPVAMGWYRLAAISKNNEADIERQLADVEQWMASAPNHPASLNLPSDLQLLKQLVQNKPRVIGLLLPLSGPYAGTGRAVRDGLMASHFAAKQQQSNTPDVLIFDTHNRDINEVYDAAVTAGVQFIIGPLLKEDIQELGLRLDLAVPTLALNSIDNPYGYPPSLYQFGLPVEDEARQVAQRAWVEGLRNAMILAQQSETGQRAADAFEIAWKELGGNVVQRSYFADQADYQNVIKKSLLVADSEQRARQLKRLIGNDVFFEEPRRRQDIDLIFMMARPAEAQLLKPTLNFHFASNVPVYATRHIYVGNPTAKSNRDLNGVRFTTLPWFFDSESQIRQTIQANAKPSPAYQQFYAMGVDAYQLHPRLPLLKEITGARFYGATGALRVTADQQISREQIWVQITDGIAQPMPMIVSDELTTEQANLLH